MTGARTVCWYTTAAMALVGIHAVVPALCGPSIKFSNILQFLAAALAMVFCHSVSRRTTDQYLRPMWQLLCVAFGLWSAAQGYFTFVLLVRNHILEYPSSADALWLAFALPVLLIVIRQRNRVTDWVSWLDAGQAGVFFSLLAVLVFSRKAGLAITQAYDVQGAALVLLCGLQYSRSERIDKLFFRDLGVYLLTYAVLSSADYRIEKLGLSPGSIVDICWTLPPCLFVVLAQRTQRRLALQERRSMPLGGLQAAHSLYGTSAFGLFALSLTIGIFLHHRQAVLGTVYIGVATVVFAARSIYRDTQIVRANRDLRDAFVRDSLTRLPNRRCLMDAAVSGVDHTSPLLLCNLDNVKLLNESLGRDFVDAVVQSVADRLSHARHVQQVFRVGGDEFVLLLHTTGAAAMHEAAAQLLQTVREPLNIRGRRLLITATFGAAAVASASVEEVLLQAEAAVAHGKQRGRDQFVEFTPCMQRDAAARLEFEAHVRLAIETGKIVNHYQAIQCTSSKQIVGFEALARWMEHGKSVASPAQFIPVAEDTWMILELGRKLLSQACEDVLRFSKAAKRPLWVSVNVSGKQLQDPALVEHIRAELKRTGAPASSLKLEVTESFFLDDTRTAVERLQQLHSLGLKIAIDDFGTGYSSLSYLATLPFEVLKIDRSFVAGLEPNSTRAKVTRAVVQLAKVLEKEIVAEGVETRSEEEQLIAMGCDLLQGYLISRPVPLMEAIAMVQRVPECDAIPLAKRTDLLQPMTRLIAS